jgi:hypothetical protein
LPFPLYLDAEVHPIVARILRGRGFDAEIGELGRRMTKVLGSYSTSDMINRFVWLQSFA